MEDKIPVINCRYQPVSTIGTGSNGYLYLVHDLLMDNASFALKIINPSEFNSAEGLTLRDINKKYDIIKNLKHPNIVQIYDFGIMDESFFIVMEYLEGESLRNIISSHKQLHLVEILQITAQVSRALDFIHSRDLLYSEISPSNIIISNNIPVLLDFGLSETRYLIEGKPGKELLYKAPESLTGDISFSSDYFSLGVLLYEMIAGRKYYLADNISHENFDINVMKEQKVFEEHRENALSLLKDDRCRQILRRFLSFDKAERHRNSTEIIDDINKFFNTSFEIETSQTRESYTLGCSFADRQNDLAGMKSRLDEKSINFHIYSGPAGIGKTRLFKEFGRYCRSNNIDFYEASCSEGEVTEYCLISDLLQNMVSNSGQGLLLEYSTHLRYLLPDHPLFRGYHDLSIKNQKALREIITERISDYFLDFFSSLSRKAVIAIYNLQWLEEGSAGILKRLLEKIEFRDNNGQNFAFFASLSEDMMGENNNITEILINRRTEACTLKELDEQGTGDYLINIFGRHFIDESIKDSAGQIRDMAGGKPLFLSELIKSLIAEGFIYKENGCWKSHKYLKNKDINKNIQEIARKRMEGVLSDRTIRLVLHIMSLLRVDLSFEMLNSLLRNLYNKDLSKILILLENQEILKFIRFHNYMAVNFSSTFLKDIVKQTIDDKNLLNRLLGEYLETLPGRFRNSLLEETAYHFMEAGVKDKAVRYYTECADSSQDRHFNEKALRLYDTVLQIIPENNKEKRLQILLKKAISLEALSRWDAAAELLEEIIESAETRGFLRLHGKAYNISGSINIKQGYYEKAKEALDKSLGIFKNNQISNDYAETIYNIGNYYFEQSHLKEAISYYEEYKELCIKLNDRANYSSILNEIGNVYYLLSDYIMALEYYESYKELSRKSEEKRDYGIALGNIGNVYYILGDYEKALKYFQDYGKITLEIGDKREYKNAMCSLGNIYYVMGSFEEALKHYSTSHDVSKEIGDKRGRSNALGNLGNIYLFRNDNEKALECFETLLEISKEIGYKTGQGFAVGSIGNIYYNQGQFEKALGNYEESVNLYQEINDRMRFGFAITNMGYVYFDQGKFQQALECFEIHRNISEEIGDLRAYGISAGNIANVYYIKKDYQKSLEYIDKAINTFSNLKLQNSLCRYLNMKTSIFIELGNISKASELNLRAIETAEKASLPEEMAKAMIEKYKILSYTEPQQSISALEGLIDDCSDDDIKAEIYYQLWKISRKEQHKQRAFDAYKDLYEAAPRFEYKTRMSEF